MRLCLSLSSWIVVSCSRLLKYAPSTGSQLPLVVYGPSVPTTTAWLNSNATFFPGPAFWNETARSSRVAISSVAAPPIAADVAWQIFQLAPRETSLGVVGYQSDAVKFLCQVFEPLRAMQTKLIEARKDNATQLLAAHVRLLFLLAGLDLWTHALW